MTQMTFSGWPENSMENIRVDDRGRYATRPKRRTAQLPENVTALATDGALCYISEGKLFVEEYPVEATLSPGEKQLLQLGHEVLVLPDKLVVNMLDLSCEPAEAVWQGECRYSLCDAAGRVYTLNYHGTTQPADPVCGEYWVDTTVTPTVLRQFNPNGNWVIVPQTCIRLEADGLGRRFSKGDCLQISGQVVSGAKTVRQAGTNYIVVDGIMGQSLTGIVTLQRLIPDMDILFPCGDRLWGCRWGLGINRIYCSRPGDCRNWLAAEISEEAPWQAEVASAGRFTGGMALGKTPVFFKEHFLHRVTGAAPGSFRVETVRCSGVRPDGGDSLAVAEGTLYYCSGEGIMAYTGADTPKCVLPGSFAKGHAGALGKDYCLSCVVSGSAMFLRYDTRRKLCCREDGLQATCLRPYGSALLCIADGMAVELCVDAGGNEIDFPWHLETDMEYPSKTPKTVHIRGSLRGSAQLSISYDGGQWELLESMDSKTPVSYWAVNTRCKACNCFRLRLEGTGRMTLQSIGVTA